MSETRLRFNDVFWGEKSGGYEAMYANLRSAQQSVKDLEGFIRESAQCEDTYVKQLNKLTAQIQKYSTETSISPIWAETVKELNERNSWSHYRFMHRLHEIIKMIQSYADDLKKKRQKIKESENKTQLVSEAFRNCKAQLLKSREQYYQACYDLNKHRQSIQQEQQISGSLQQQNLTHLFTQLAKLERKVQLCLEEYKLSIEKYNLTRNEYERRLGLSCDVFQRQEEDHLNQV